MERSDGKFQLLNLLIFSPSSPLLRGIKFRTEDFSQAFTVQSTGLLRVSTEEFLQIRRNKLHKRLVSWGIFISFLSSLFEKARRVS